MIRIEHPDAAQLAALGVEQWPVWEHGVAEFPWTYGEQETCFILQGSATITPQEGEPVRIQAGELVTFPAGMSCRWNITADIRKHYRFG
ncbi:MAG TPA: cupin domain-containing protein [Mariprofundaceae bacterium]|nr:cupin domain-containing protein [Mariprofundaceae bacterium]